MRRVVSRAFLLSVFVLVAWSCADHPSGALRAIAAPHFTCTPPKKDTDENAIPATGERALKEFRFYLDQPVDLDGHIASEASVSHASDAPSCVWQVEVGEISSGPHSVRVTAVNNAGEESMATKPLKFAIP